ncbi:G-D-S-L family lipolytic protein [Chishuiella changwenlii]|uniref:G-D-S-L family lipolytic protein n=1 Tax=Chishuiella changwenlii TaxID=1434701 RepID=UPI002FDB1595
MKHLNKIILVALAATTFSCNDDFEHPIEDIQISAGEADFTKYIALGNSLTSGYRDNALYSSGQENSYPNILAGLMKAAGGGEFKTPLMPNNTGGFTNLPGFPGKLELQIVNGALSPVPTTAAAALDNVAAGGPYQNMGVPGAKSYHLVVDGYGNPAGLATATANPYFYRFATNGATSVVKDAVAQSPTFFSLWIGNNDVLGYATSGGVGVDHNETGNVAAATYASGDISNVAVVKGSIDGILTAMTANGAKGVIANIPSVTAIPYFTTVPSLPITGLTAEQVAALSSAQAYGAYNAGLGQARAANLITAEEYQARLIKFTAGNVANGAVIQDKDLTNLSALGLPSYRQTTSKDLIVLTAASLLRQGFGTQTALADQYVLTEKETAKAEAAVTKFNTAISELATKHNLAFVDAYSEMKKLSSVSGIKYYGQTYTTTFVSGGAFSLDGVHLTGSGYAIVANMFADAINRKYKSTLRHVYPGNYPGIAIP